MLILGRKGYTIVWSSNLGRWVQGTPGWVVRPRVDMKGIQQALMGRLPWIFPFFGGNVGDCFGGWLYSRLLCCVTAVQPWQMARHGTNRYQRARWTISRRTLHVSRCWRCEKSCLRSSWDHRFNPPWIRCQQPFFFSALGRTFRGFHHGWAKVTAAMEMVLHSKVWSMYIPWNLLGDLFRLMSVASIWLLKTVTKRFSDRCRICWELLKWFWR